MRYHLHFLSLAAAALKSCIFSLHKARFHQSSCLHSSTSVCDEFRPVVAGSNLAWCLTAVSFLTEQPSHFCPNIIWSVRVVFVFSQILRCSQVKTWQLYAVDIYAFLDLIKCVLKNLYIYIPEYSYQVFFLLLGFEVQFKSEFKTIKNLYEKQIVGWLGLRFFPSEVPFERTTNADIYCSAWHIEPLWVVFQQLFTPKDLKMYWAIK